MSLEELEALIRKYLSAGIAAVVIVVAPGNGAAAPDGTPPDPSVRIIEPAEPGGTDANTGAGGRDPERGGHPRGRRRRRPGRRQGRRRGRRLPPRRLRCPG